MEYKRFGSTVYARFDLGEEVIEQVRALALRENVKLGHISALGATDDFTVGVYDTDAQEYRSLRFTGSHEIVSLTGTVNTMDGEFYTHLHMSAANGRGQVVGGHLKSCRISATCELVLEITDGALDRRRDEVTGLNLFDFQK